MHETADDLLSSDRSVLDAYRRGDRAACLQVYRFYVQDVARWVREGVIVFVDGNRTKLGAVLDEAEAENLIQEIFLRVFQSTARESYDGIRPFRSYLLSISRNTLIDAARRLQVRQKGSAKIIWEPGVEKETPESKSEEDELTALLQSWKAECSDEQQQVWQLRFEEEKSLRETAKSLSMGMFRVRKIDLLLRQEILEKLQENGYLKEQSLTLKVSILRRNDKKIPESN